MSRKMKTILTFVAVGIVMVIAYKKSDAVREKMDWLFSKIGM
jgi:hypothetical protein